MSIDLVLKPSCYGCQSTAELYGSACKHLTLCVTCGRKMAEGRMCCRECGTPLTRLIREYNVHACSTSDKNYFIGRFVTGLPNFSKKKGENKWSMQKEGLQGRQITDTLREKYKNKPWLLEDEAGFQYQGHLEGSQSATYYLLLLQGGEFKAIPAGSWYNFNKVAQYKQLTLEEAEEKMKNRRRTADGYERWMMKSAINGAATFGEVERIDDKEGGTGGRGGRKKSGGDDDEGNASDRGDEDEDEETSRRNRLGLRKKGVDDDEEGLRGGDFDLDDDIERGDDWEHEEIFTDDDEASAIHPEEREDLAPEIPAPPEIKNDEDDEEEGNEEDGGGGGGLSKSGKELKKLLGRANGLDDSDDSDSDDDDDDDVEDTISPVLAPKKETVKQEPAEDKTPSKATASSSAKGTPSTSKSAKGKRKVSEDAKASGTPLKKIKSETDVKPVKSESPSTKSSAAPKAGPSQSPAPRPASTPPPTGPVTEEEIRAVLMGPGPVTTQNLVEKFKPRLRKREDKDTFAAILRRISKIQKTTGSNYVVLRPS